jgi:hypothetical protein
VVAGPRQRAGLEAQGARRTECLGLRGLNSVAGRHHTGLGLTPTIENLVRATTVMWWNQISEVPFPALS